jgi:hypothetical protein
MISIKNKVNSKHSLKSYQSINNWWEKNIWWGVCCHASLREKKKINSKPCCWQTAASKMSMLGLVPKTDTQPNWLSSASQHSFNSQNRLDRQKLDSNHAVLGHIVDWSFFLSVQIPYSFLIERRLIFHHFLENDWNEAGGPIRPIAEKQ